jgi:hypothetical protein
LLFQTTAVSCFNELQCTGVQVMAACKQ